MIIAAGEAMGLAALQREVAGGKLRTSGNAKAR